MNSFRYFIWFGDFTELSTKLNIKVLSFGSADEIHAKFTKTQNYLLMMPLVIIKAEKIGH